MITDDVRTGGVAYVARLLRAALREIAGLVPYELSLAHTAIDAIPPVTAAGYAARLLSSAVRSGAGIGAGRADWWMFDHVASAQPMILLPRALRPAYGVFIHDTDGWGEAMPARRARTFRMATVRLANSRFTAGRTEAAHPEIGPVVPCPLGLLPAPAGVAPPPLDAPRRRDVLILGRLSSATRYKGHDLLIESWGEVRRAAPGARLLVAGDGDDAPRLRELARKRGVADAVVFLGFVTEEELERTLHEISALAMPSTGEGFGLAYLRAMRAAVPCVALSAGVTPEVIVHGESGLLSHPGDRRGLVDSIVTLLTDDVLRRMLGRGARERYDAHFTFEHFTRRLETAIAPLIERAGERR